MKEYKSRNGTPMIKDGIVYKLGDASPTNKEMKHNVSRKSLSPKNESPFK